MIGFLTFFKTSALKGASLGGQNESRSPSSTYGCSYTCPYTCPDLIGLINISSNFSFFEILQKLMLVTSSSHIILLFNFIIPSVIHSSINTFVLRLFHCVNTRERKRCLYKTSEVSVVRYRREEKRRYYITMATLLTSEKRLRRL